MLKLKAVDKFNPSKVITISFDPETLTKDNLSLYSTIYCLNFKAEISGLGSTSQTRNVRYYSFPSQQNTKGGVWSIGLQQEGNNYNNYTLFTESQKLLRAAVKDKFHKPKDRKAKHGDRLLLIKER